jgi:hypothetical protein
MVMQMEDVDEDYAIARKKYNLLILYPSLARRKLFVTE